MADYLVNLYDMDPSWSPEKLEEPDPQPLPGESEKEEASAQEERTEEAPAEGTKE